MKIAVSTYSFERLLENGMTMDECVKKIKEMGFDAVEFAGLQLTEGESRAACAARMRTLCDTLSLPVASYTIGADFLNGREGGAPQDEPERLKREVDVAEMLHAPVMRHDITWRFGRENRGYKGFENVLPVLADGCREVTAYAAGKGIRTMVENHGYFAQESRLVEKLVNTVAHENFGLLVDIGNFLCVDEDPITAVSRTAPYAFHVHAKDFHVKSGSGPDPGQGFFPSRGGNYLRGSIIGHGVVPVTQCLRALRMAGYDGYVSIEFEGMEDNLTALSVGLENLRRYIG